MNDAYVITYNRFTSSYTGGAILLLESPKMAAGLAPQVFMWLTTTAWPVWGYSMLPGGSDNVQGPPPAGSAVPIVALKGTSLVIMKATWNYAAGTASMYGATNPWVLSVASFTRLCPRGACVVQPSTSRRLDGLGDRLMNRLVYNWMGSYDSVRKVQHLPSCWLFCGVIDVRTAPTHPRIRPHTYLPGYRWWSPTPSRRASAGTRSATSIRAALVAHPCFTSRARSPTPAVSRAGSAARPWTR